MEHIEIDTVIPYIAEKDGNLVEASDGFLKLTGFEREDLYGKPFLEVWKNTLRIAIDFPSQESNRQAFLLTKSLDAIEVNICFSHDKDCKIIIFEGIKTFEVSEKFPYIHSLSLTNIHGVAVWGISQGIVLLHANQTFLDFLDAPYNNKTFSIGKRINEIITGWDGSSSEQIWKSVLDTGEYVCIDEYRYDGFQRGVTYWRATLMPILENRVMKYAVEITEDITERIIDRQHIEEQAKTIRQQNYQLEKILEHIHDAMIVFDKHGNLVKMNAEARKMYSDSCSTTHVSEFHSDCQYFDMHDNAIPKEKLPIYRAFRGERVRNERVVTKACDDSWVMEVNTTPVFDDDGNLQWVISSYRDITESFSNQQRLLSLEKEKREALETAMKVKDEFLYLITHEFKTPMAVICSALQAIELMCRHEVTERLGKYLNTIKANTNRQLRLVNNLLDITRANSGHARMRPGIFDVVHILKSIVYSVDDYAKQKGVSLNFISDIKNRLVYLDEEKFERIMLNLLSNALKFTPKGNNILVELTIRKKRQRDFIFISVNDEGIGIPKDRQKVIFERFGQVDSSLSRQAEGTGLGLHLVNLLVKAMNGEILLKSKVGKGSTFSLLLPIVEPTALEEITVCDNQNNMLMSNDSRIIQAASIEFSDIYFE